MTHHCRLPAPLELDTDGPHPLPTPPRAAPPATDNPWGHVDRQIAAHQHLGFLGRLFFASSFAAALVAGGYVGWRLLEWWEQR